MTTGAWIVIGVYFGLQIIFGVLKHGETTMIKMEHEVLEALIFILALLAFA